MSQRRGEVMSRKPPGSSGKRHTKRGTYSDQFESQDIWKNLDRIRHSNKLAGKPIRNSFICMKFPKNIDPSMIKDCISELHKYIEQDTLELKQTKYDGQDRYLLILKKFTILDCCLSLVVISNIISTKDISTSSRNSYFTIPIESELSCTLFMLANCKYIKNRYMFHRDNVNFKVLKSSASTLPNFEEIRISTNAGKSLSNFIQGLANLLSDIKFGKYPQSITNSICNLLWNPEKQLSFGLSEMRYLQNGLQNPNAMSEYNKALDQSQKELVGFKEQLVEYTKSLTRDKSAMNNQTGTLQGSNANLTSSASGNINRGNINRETNGNQNNTANAQKEQFNKSGFQSQDDIKEHCVATISASKEVVTSKNPQEIFKMYIRVPKLKYTDIIYQNLNDLRNKTKCNIVVLNLNNLHESEAWLASLDVAKYTSVVQPPHPSTVRVVSIGGVSEYILTTLDLISDIMKS